MNRTIIIYHTYSNNPCADGFGAAYAAWKKFGDKASYVGVTHEKPTVPNIDGANVYVLDFSFPREVLLDMRKRANKVIVIDHHKSAEAELKGMPDTIFDMTKSGAILAWEYFHGNKPIPELLLYVQDRDLWNWNLPKSKEITAALDRQPYLFTAWDKMNLGKLYEQGKTIIKEINEYVASAISTRVIVSLFGYAVPLVRSPKHASEIGNALASLYPFAITYDVGNDGIYKYSLRSSAYNPDAIDVSELAKRLVDIGVATNGGGHKHAAGFGAKKFVNFNQLK